MLVSNLPEFFFVYLQGLLDTSFIIGMDGVLTEDEMNQVLKVIIKTSQIWEFYKLQDSCR